VLDASVELWAGAHGSSPLDVAVDELAGVAARHIAKGDRVGLVVFASRARTWLAPGTGPLQASKISAALASAASMVDGDRCELDEAEVAQRVAEHLRPLDPRALQDVPRGNLDALAIRAEAMRSRAPFAPRLPMGATPREQRFRHYLASFGVEVAPRVDGERGRADVQLAGLLEKLSREKNGKKKPSIVHVWAPALTGPESMVGVALRKLKARHVEVRWTMPSFEPGLSTHADAGRSVGASATVEGVVVDAVRIRVRASQARAERAMRALGVRARAIEVKRHGVRGDGQ
jgi:uncharacterized protein (DUF58 family)